MFRSQLKSARFVRRSEGFLLIDALIGAAIIFAGLAALLNMMPDLQRMSYVQTYKADIGDYILAKQQDLYTEPFQDINTTTPQSGNFTNLIGTSATGVSAYQWSYSATNVVPGVLKKVQLTVSNLNAGESSAITVYIADMENTVAP